MIRIVGNSKERVSLRDMSDVIYYKQVKEYTDQEYNDSKDLKSAVNNGKVVIIEKIEAGRPSSLADKNNTSITISDIRTILRELLPEFKNNKSDNLTEIVRELGPLIASVIRQELSMTAFSRQESFKAEENKFIGPEYVPDVSMEGMISNIEAKKTDVSGDPASEALAALKKLNKI